MTPFKSLATFSGLSLKECAAYLGMPDETARSYWYGARNAPTKSLRQLHRLAYRVSTLAAEIAEGIAALTAERQQRPEKISLRIITTKTAAKEIRLPFPSTHGAVIALALASIPRNLVSIVSFSGDQAEDVIVE